MTMSNEELLAWLRITLTPGISSRMQRELLSGAESAQAAVARPRQELRRILGEDGAAALAHAPDPHLVEATLGWLAQPRHSIITLADPDYPRALLETGGPPCVLYANGRRELLGQPAMAVVGSRNATPQGVRDAEAFAFALSEAGLCVVSGLALGIDSAAHRGGLRGRSSSIAVMGTGPDRIYPARNRELAHALAQDGCLITEFALGTPASAGNFPRRNRLISGLARGVLVVEAALRSGSLITARLAVEQGRDVFAIPGSIHSALSKGCHELIREGAKLVESAQDVLVELGMAPPAAEPAKAQRENAHPLLQGMGFAPTSVDQVAQRTGLSAATVCAQLTQLEIEGRVEALSGGLFQRIA